MSLIAFVPNGILVSPPHTLIDGCKGGGRQNSRQVPPLLLAPLHLTPLKINPTSK